ncbi:MAG: C40 family peptidase [Promicromonosporaceae bacterium]|nr:C40 family peptidase [Promicromonosporaceae bacterium]
MTAARHRAARRPLTPITGITQMVGAGTSRRAAVVATASGLLMSSFATGAAQTEHLPSDAGTMLNTVNLDAISASALAALEIAPTVTIPADTQIVVESVAIDAKISVEVTPAPAPEPVTVVITPVRQEAPAARSNNDRPAAAAPAAPAFAAPPASVSGVAVLEIAARYVGVPYVFGGSTPAGFDCSGFTRHVFAQVGINLPRTSRAQRNAGTVVSAADARPGDLIWWPGHVAIYAGNGQMIDSPRPGDHVRFRAISRANVTFIRLTGPAPAPEAPPAYEPAPEAYEPTPEVYESAPEYVESPPEYAYEPTAPEAD